jgi:predicted RNase H-like HicB family nuclease
MQITDTIELSAVIRKENDFYVASCPEYDIASQGKNIEEALKNLKEALELYLEDQDIEKPAKAEAPIVTIVKVKISGSSRNLRSKSD